MSRTPPTSRCLALLRAFDQADAAAPAKIEAVAAVIESALSPRALADLNEGQFAAIIDFVIWKGLAAFTSDTLFLWIEDGNLTLPPIELAEQFDKRGKAESQMWNLGNTE